MIGYLGGIRGQITVYFLYTEVYTATPKYYTPPFSTTPIIVALVTEIAEAIGRMTMAAESAAVLRLRRINRIRTIQGTLAIETVIHARQSDYYQALHDSTQAGASTVFLEFMLGVIRAALADQVTEQATEQIARLLLAVGDGQFSTRELMVQVGLSHRPTFLYDYLQPALAGGWLEMTIPDRPKSPRQQYRLTKAGRELIACQ